MGKAYVTYCSGDNLSEIKLEDITMDKYIKYLECVIRKDECNILEIHSGWGYTEARIRASVIAQRLFNAGHTVFERENSEMEWNPFIDKNYSEEFMYQVDCEEISSDFHENMMRIRDVIAYYEENPDEFNKPSMFLGDGPISLLTLEDFLKENREILETMQGIDKKVRSNLKTIGQYLLLKNPSNCGKG